jgi:hypothetical protein
VTTLDDFGGVLGRPCFLLGCHNFMVTALGSCVKWAEVSAASGVPNSCGGPVRLPVFSCQARQAAKSFWLAARLAG